MLNNSLFKDIYTEILNAHYILIIPGKNAKIDTLCASLALSNFLFENKIKHKVLNDSNVDLRKLNFLTKFDKMTESLPKYYDLVICFDSENEFSKEKYLLSDAKIISFSNNNSQYNMSSSEFMYLFFQFNNLNVSKNTAECLYSGIYEDSLGFKSDNVNAQTFDIISSLTNCGISTSQISNKLVKRESLAKFRCLPKIMNTLELYSEGKIATVCLYDSFIKETGIEIDECDDIVELVSNIGIVDTVAYFRIIDKSIFISIKSKRLVDLSLIPNSFNYRSDRNSADLTISSTNIDIVKEQVVNTILNYI